MMKQTGMASSQAGKPYIQLPKPPSKPVQAVLRLVSHFDTALNCTHPQRRSGRCHMVHCDASMLPEEDNEAA